MKAPKLRGTFLGDKNIRVVGQSVDRFFEVLYDVQLHQKFPALEMRYDSLEQNFRWLFHLYQPCNVMNASREAMEWDAYPGMVFCLS